MNSYKNNYDFLRLIDDIMVYSNYSFFNTLLINYQYQNFLDLKTKSSFQKQGYEVMDNATKVNILSPENDVYVSVKNGNTEKIKLLNDLTDDELIRYNNSDDKSVLFHHNSFNGLHITELFDCKDTNMKKSDYKTPDLPPLLYTDYDSIYNSFVKAFYADGYKINYCNNIDNKYLFDKDNKILNLKNGLSSQMKIKCILEAYSTNISSTTFEKDLFNYAINKNIGVDDELPDKVSFFDWYNKTEFKDVEHCFRLLSTKGRKFINNFNKFYKLEQKEFIKDDIDLYNDFNFSI